MYNDEHAAVGTRCAGQVAKQVFKVGLLVEMIGLILPMAHIFQKRPDFILN